MALAKPEEYADRPRRVFSKETLPSVDDEVDELILVAGDRDWDARVLRDKVLQRRQKALMFSFIAMVFISLANQVFKKLQTVPMYNYPNFLNLWTTFMYIPFSFAYIIPMVRYGSSITREQLNVPKSVFMTMGLLDAVAGVMQIFASVYLSGSMQILLMQAAIPISMGISKKLLNSRYVSSQYAGASVVALGILVVLGPSLTAQGSGTEMLWAVVLIASCVPMVFSNVYKEMALGDAELDPIYLNGWTAVFQLFFSFFLAVPAGLAGDPRVSPKSLPKNIWDGFKCFLGMDSVKTGSHPDQCWPGSPLFVSLYSIINVSYNILIILMLKYGSANIMFLAFTTTVPLGNIAFSLKFMPGHTHMRSTDVVGLIAIMGGLVLYRFGDHILGRWHYHVGGKRDGGFTGGGGGGGGDFRQPLLQVDEDGQLSEENSSVNNPFTKSPPKNRASDNPDGSTINNGSSSTMSNGKDTHTGRREKPGASASTPSTATATTTTTTTSSTSAPSSAVASGGVAGGSKDKKTKKDGKLYHL